MTAKILNGNILASEIRANVAAEIAQRMKKNVPAPGLAVIQVGDHAPSTIYIEKKQQACKEVGILSTLHHLDNNTTEDELLDLIEKLNDDPSIHGILVQLPLPSHMNSDVVLDYIDPLKDVDGFHPYNVGCLAQRRPFLRPCTPFGVMQLLESTGEPLRGKHAVIVGASNIVGRPMALELLLAGATVTVAHRYTTDLEKCISMADILIVAIGNPGIIETSWIPQGAIVIDVGITRLDDGSLSGDIDFATAKEKASWITPVPGGVGPMTVASLLINTVLAWRLTLD